LTIGVQFAFTGPPPVELLPPELEDEPPVPVPPLLFALPPLALPPPLPGFELPPLPTLVPAPEPGEPEPGGALTSAVQPTTSVAATHTALLHMYMTLTSRCVGVSRK
jgi:hypothetical protein